MLAASFFFLISVDFIVLLLFCVSGIEKLGIAEMCCWLRSVLVLFFNQVLSPKEKDNMDAVGSAVDDEINATAEVGP